MAMTIPRYRKTSTDTKTVRQFLSYDPSTGILRWRVSKGRAPAGAIAGYLGPDGYLRVGINNEIYMAHRLIWLYVHGKWPGIELDHVNGNPADNRIENLRNGGISINRQNLMAAHKDSTTKMLGVYKNRWPANPYRAQIRVNGRAIHLGTFSTPEDAHRAYLAAKRRYHAGCTI